MFVAAVSEQNDHSYRSRMNEHCFFIQARKNFEVQFVNLVALFAKVCQCEQGGPFFARKTFPRSTFRLLRNLPLYIAFFMGFLAPFNSSNTPSVPSVCGVTLIQRCFRDENLFEFDTYDKKWTAQRFHRVGNCYGSAGDVFGPGYVFIRNKTLSLYLFKTNWSWNFPTHIAS